MIVTDILGALKDIHDIISSVFRNKRKLKQELFNEFYRPLFEDFIVIHSDYISNIQNIGYLINTETAPDKIIESIKTIRQKHLIVRENIKGFGSAFPIAIERKVSNAEHNLIRGIDLYLTSYFQGRTSFTGISYLLETFQNNIESGDIENLENHVYENKITYFKTTMTYREYLLNQLDRCELWLNSQFSEVAYYYNIIRIDMLFVK